MKQLRPPCSLLRAVSIAAFVAAAAVGAAAQGAGAPTTSQRPAEPPASASDARQFINEMAVAGMAEVKLGQMAADRAASSDVKAFGQMMVKDHSQANDELKQVASQLKVQPPAELDKKHQDLADRLSKLQGADFDREYTAAMVQGHEEVVAKLRARAGNRLTSSEAATSDRPAGAGAVGTTGTGANEQALTQWAAKALPTVQQHLERAQDLQKKLAK
jgi:putative membrane protein